jgi:kinesin family protein 5
MTTLRFGTAARNIKNRPKINREYTVDELKKMLGKRDKIIKAYEGRLQTLEDFIKENNLDVPTDEAMATLTLSPEKGKKDTNDIDNAPNFNDEDLDRDFGAFGVFKETNLLNYESERDDLEKRSQLGGKNEDLVERINDLQQHLDREKEIYNAQCDHMSNLKEDYDLIKDKLSKIESQKDQLDTKVSSVTSRSQI